MNINAVYKRIDKKIGLLSLKMINVENMTERQGTDNRKTGKRGLGKSDKKTVTRDRNYENNKMEWQTDVKRNMAQMTQRQGTAVRKQGTDVSKHGTDVSKQGTDDTKTGNR